MIALLLATLIATSSISPYQQLGIQALALDDGVVLVWNQPDDYFTLELRGRRVQPLPYEGRVFFGIDGAVLQVTTVPLSEFLADASRHSERAVLEAHRDWEVRFIGEALGSELAVTSSMVTLADGSVALSWNYRMPARGRSDASSQYYLSVVRGKRLILLNGAVTEQTTERAVAQLLAVSLATLKVHNAPIDMTRLQDRIKNTGRP